MSISIIVATYGVDYWKVLAAERAVPTAQEQGAHEVVIVHQPGGTVSSARNQGAEESSGEWLCFLDADDALEQGFVAAMEQAMLEEFVRDPVGDVLFTPAVSYVDGHRRRPPMIWPRVPLESGNWLVIGTLISRRLFFEVGMFKDYGDPPGSNAFEDWALWGRCHKAGARVVEVPTAIYIAHRERLSRHRGSDHWTRLNWHYEIGRALFPDHYPDNWMNVNSRPVRQPRRARTR